MCKITKSFAWAAALVVLLGVYQARLISAEEVLPGSGSSDPVPGLTLTVSPAQAPCGAIDGCVPGGSEGLTPDVEACPLPERCIDLEKTGPTISSPGSVITYHYWVHNCGNVAFRSGAQVYDPLLREDPIWDGELEPGDIHEFSMTYTLPADHCGDFVNHAWASNNIWWYPEVRDDDEWTVFVDCGVVPSPSIDVEKLVSLDDQVWEDADNPAGPEVVVDRDVWFRFVVTNTGNVSLTGVTLSDSAFDLDPDTCPVSSVLAPDGTIDCKVGPFEAIRGQHVNTATVTGDYDEVTYSDQDSAHYVGVIPSVDVEKALGVSSDGGWQEATWYDADSPPGPRVDENDELWFRFTVTNTGDVSLTDVLVEDSDLNLVDYGCNVPSVLASGAVSECVIGPFAAEIGPHVNTVTVTGFYGGQAYTDEDSAHYSRFAPTGLSIGPTSVTILAGRSAIYRATVEDSDGIIWDVTDETIFGIDAAAGGFWVDNVYTSEVPGTWTVTGQYYNLSATGTARVVSHMIFLPLALD